ncbi:MAG TPA: glycoside hydrolase family 2 TIM barrel-domain containing protein [Candidatus Acidoferrales bacterium]|nr:glycoside hydrolase family 2 TIM barrel-domain containing protein [Candidatus Acidoferrales bacterium]
MRLVSFLLAALLVLFPARGSDDWRIAAGPLQTPWAAEVSPTNALPGYPRPQLVRPDWLNLNGLWDYAIRPDDGELPASFQGKILVPFPIESALSGVMRDLDEQHTLWYRRTFSVPSAWSDRRIILRFGAVDWQATVYVNGIELGRHRGGYDAFSFDITEALKPGKLQEVAVAVFDPTEGDQPRGKQSRKPEGIFYRACSGIWQTVWLEPVPAAGITGLKLMPNPDTGALRLRVFTQGCGDGFQIEAVATAGSLEAGRAGGTVNSELVLPLKPARLWSPDDPFLYDLRVALKHGGRTVDEVSSYFGLRSVGLRRDERGVSRPTLNGDFIFQIGALDQGYWPDGIYTAPTDAALQHDLRFLKSAGFNLVRKHVKVEPDRWYYWCDKLGLLVWQDMPSGNNNTPEARERFEAELERMVEQLRNHPCITTWVVFNESWGQFDSERLTRSLKELDPSRLVDTASGWTDKHVGDLSDAHSYPVPDSPPGDTSRALVIGEFGGLGLPLPGHLWSADTWSYQMLPDEPALAGWYYYLLQEIWSQKETRGLSAAIYTQTTDVETECNGLLTYDRRVIKIPADRLAAMNRGEIYRRTMDVILTNAVFGESVWRYTFDQPSPLWNLPAYDDRGWKEGPAGFGTAFTRGSRVHTEWNSSDIWLRRSFVLRNQDLRQAKFHLHHDKSVGIYLNGVEALVTKSYLVNYALFDISPPALAALHPGTNCIAVHCDQTAGGQFIDVGIVTLQPPQPDAAIAP